MKLLRQMGIIFGVYYMGQIISPLLPVVVPGNVLGMVLLLIFLNTGLIKIEQIEETANFFLLHLAFFFIPACIGLIQNGDVLLANIGPIILILSISSILVTVATGWSVKFLQGKVKSHV